MIHEHLIFTRTTLLTLLGTRRVPGVLAAATHRHTRKPTSLLGTFSCQLSAFARLLTDAVVKQPPST